MKIKWGLLIALFLGAFYFAKKRSFYYSKDKTECITVWKRIGGKCLITCYSTKAVDVAGALHGAVPFSISYGIGKKE